MAKTPVWQRKAGQNPKGGLNEAGRRSLRAEGHDIKRPQPEGGARKKSFCARMEGAKKKLTSAETANDPDSRINKSLRAWNCADGGAVDPYDSVQQAAKGGPIWDKPRPKKLGKPEPLSSKEKSSAKAAAKAAGRPYPNLIDNMRAARADGGELDPYEAVQNAANTDGGMGNFSAEDIQRASHGATPAVPALTVTENAQPSTPVSDSLRGAYNAAIPPTARLLAEGAMGVHSPITERDFSQSDIQNMKDRLAEQQQSNADREKNLQDIQNFMTPEKYRHYQAMTEQPIGGDEDYRLFMAQNAEKLKSFQDTRGQTAVPYGTTFGKEDQANQPLSVYTPEQGNLLTSLQRSYNDPGYRTGMTLGRFNVYDTPQGRVAVDTYDFRGRKQTPSEMLHEFQTQPTVTAIRGAIPTVFPNIERPVAVNLDRHGNYTYTGKPIVTPGSHLDPSQTATPSRDIVADYQTKTPGLHQFSQSAAESRTPNVTAVLPPRRPVGYADGGEVIGDKVQGDVQFSPDDPYAKVQEAAKLPMMAQNDFAMRMPEPEVRYDTGPQPGEATLKAYDPTIKERIYQGLAGTEERPSPERAQFARGMSQMAEFAPVLGNVMAGQEAQRRGDTKGMLMAALPVPGMATEARMAEAAAGPAQQAAREAYQRVLNAQGLYSHAAEAAANLPQAKGSYEQMMAMLQKAGVKPEEMRWSGVEQFAGQPVTREQLVSHFEQNVPKIEETVLGGHTTPYPHRTADEWENAIDRAERAGDWDESNRLNAAWEQLQLGTGVGRPKFEQYTIPGGENYREVLLGLPDPASTANGNKVADFAKSMHEKYGERWIGEMSPAEESQYDALINAQSSSEVGKVYTSSHWDQPNVLGHLRLSDRTGPQGEKILHMEELQSDWGQAGRKQGFRGEPIQYGSKIAGYIPEGYSWQKTTKPNVSHVIHQLVDRSGNIVGEGSDKIEALRKSGLNPTVPTAPYVESTKNWVDLGLKRALKEAAEKGYDKLVWTPGAEQAARYKLSKHIDGLSWSPDTNQLIGFKDGVAEFVKDVPKEDLHKFIGEGAAEKLMQTEPYMLNNRAFHHLEGQEMDVGGEGMKSFYDSIIPSRLKELIKKLDPQAKVELGGHPIITERGKPTQYADFDEWNNAPESSQINAHSITITPKMRKAILKGLPAYAKGGEVVNKDDPYDNIRLKAKNFPRARRVSH